MTLYYLSEEYKDYINYDKSHLREYRFRVSGTKKEVRDWKLSGKGADYFRITDYGLLQMDWEPAYIEPCVTATVTAVLEDGRTLTAAVRAYSETNIYIDKIFTDFEKQYITPYMTQKEKAEKAAAFVCRNYDAHGQTLVFADGRFYLVITGYNEPKPRRYTMYEISGEALEKLAEENLIDLNYFYQ